MNPETERLIDLATRPLAGNAEINLAAAGDLRRQIETSAATPEDLSEAADSLERADRHPRRHYWRTTLYLTTFLVSLPVLGHTFRQLEGFSYAKDMISLFNSLSAPAADPLRKNLSPQQKLLLFGEESAPTKADRWRPLWDSEPDNPAFLAQYASGYFSEQNQLSPEILSAAEKIDSDNGWFIALSASGIADGVVTKEKQTTREKNGFQTPVWKINDPKKLNEVLALIHQAAEKPRFINYEEDLFKQRIPLLPRRIDCASQVPPFAYMASQTTAIIHLRKLLDVMCAGAQECETNHDAAGFHRIVSDWESLVANQTTNGLTLVDMLVARVFLLGPAENFRDAAKSLGLNQETSRFTQLLELKKTEKEARDNRRRGSPSEDLITSRGSLFATMTIPMIGRQVANPPLLTDADLKPSRYADHALFTRALSIVAWILFGLCAALAALQRYLRNRLVHLQSARMQDLLRLSDWVGILAGGILIPLLWYLAIIHLTPLSSREWSFKSDGFRQATCQFGSMVILMLVLTVNLSRSRLAKRGASMGLATRFPWIGWLAAACAALAVPAFGAILPAAHSRSPLEWFAPYLTWLGYALLTIPILWLFVGLSREFLGGPANALRRATLARIAFPAWIFGMLVMAASVPFHYAEERYWIQQDRLFEITADAPAMSRYEWDVTQQLRKELLEMMD